MKRFSKIVTGAAAAAMIAASSATPALARDHHGGVDAGDVIAGVAIIGGAVAIAAALDNDGNRYGYNDRNRYRGGYSAAVNACSYEADRRGRGSIRVTDVDRRSNDRYRVRGVIEGSYGGGYGGYNQDDRYDRYDRNDRYRSGAGFTCTARGNGRITDFRISHNRSW
jgi:hypothetical protein